MIIYKDFALLSPCALSRGLCLTAHNAPSVNKLLCGADSTSSSHVYTHVCVCLCTASHSRWVSHAAMLFLSLLSPPTLLSGFNLTADIISSQQRDAHQHLANPIFNGDYQDSLRSCPTPGYVR